MYQDKGLYDYEEVFRHVVRRFHQEIREQLDTEARVNREAQPRLEILPLCKGSRPFIQDFPRWYPFVATAVNEAVEFGHARNTRSVYIMRPRTPPSIVGRIKGEIGDERPRFGRETAAGIEIGAAESADRRACCRSRRRGLPLLEAHR
jgi:hypothetical protein